MSIKVPSSPPFLHRAVMADPHSSEGGVYLIPTEMSYTPHIPTHQNHNHKWTALIFYCRRWCLDRSSFLNFLRSECWWQRTRRGKDKHQRQQWGTYPSERLGSMTTTYYRRTVLSIAPFIKNRFVCERDCCVRETVVYLPIYLFVIVDALSLSRLCVCVLFNCSNVPMVSLCLHLSPKSEKSKSAFLCPFWPTFTYYSILNILFALLSLSQARDEWMNESKEERRKKRGIWTRVPSRSPLASKTDGQKLLQPTTKGESHFSAIIIIIKRPHGLCPCFSFLALTWLDWLLLRPVVRLEIGGKRFGSKKEISTWSANPWSKSVSAHKEIEEESSFCPSFPSTLVSLPVPINNSVSGPS